MEAQENLKPCPFCGSKAELIEDGDHHGEYFQLGCEFKECLAHAVYYTESEVPLDEAIAAWNTRLGIRDSLMLEALKKIKAMRHHLKRMGAMDVYKIAEQAIAKAEG